MKGILEQIVIRPVKRQKTKSVEKVEVDPEIGLVGDHYHKINGDRQVTLISLHHLDQLASKLGLVHIDSSLTRRNLLISGLDFDQLLLQHVTLKIGKKVALRITGPCKPCGQMERTIGKGAREAMADLGGLTARVVSGGSIQVGDEIVLSDASVF